MKPEQLFILHPKPVAQPAPCASLPQSPPARGRFRRGHRALLYPLWPIIALTAAGCQSLTYTGPNGEHFSRSSFASTTAIQSLSVEAGSNGLRRVELRGYTNDSTQALGAVTEAAVRGALQGVKP